MKYGIFYDSELIVAFYAQSVFEDYGQIELGDIKHTLIYNTEMNKVFIDINANEEMLVFEKNDSDRQHPAMFNKWAHTVLEFYKYIKDNIDEGNEKGLIKSIFIS